MTTQPHEHQPRDFGGRFAEKVRREDTTVHLHLAEVTPEAERSEQIYRALDLTERMVAWNNRDGRERLVAMGPDEAKEALRSVVAPTLDEETFDEHVRRISDAVAKANLLQDSADDPWDTEKWVPTAEALDVYSFDHPVPAGSWEPGDGYVDYEAYWNDASDAASALLHRETKALVDAERAARLTVV